jgi:Domain of unknown function (DUF6285)
MRTRPTPENLVATVRAYLGELQGRVDPVDAFQVRVAVHLLGIAERQLGRGAAIDAGQHAALAPFAGPAGSLDDQTRQLCRDIRAGALDERWDELLAALVDVVADEVDIVAPEKR